MNIEIFKQAQYIREDGSIEIYYGYEVSNLGRVKSYQKGKERIRKSGVCSKYGHQMIWLYKDSKLYGLCVHRLVLSTFNPESYFDNAVVDHIDSNPKNNRLGNLRWVTQKENNSTDHARRANSEAMKGKRKGSKHPMSQPCVYDNKTFNCIKEAYWYAQEYGYTKCYDTFKKMIKKQTNY